MRETDDIERLFQESFEGFEVTPPASVKAAIDQGIKRKIGLIWWLSALFLVLIAAAASIIFYTNTAQKNTKTQLSSTQETNYVNQKDSEQKAHSNSIPVQTHTNQDSGHVKQANKQLANQTGKTKTIVGSANQTKDQNLAKSKSTDSKKKNTAKNSSNPVSTQNLKNTKPQSNVKTTNKQSNKQKTNPSSKKTPLPTKNPIPVGDPELPNKEDLKLLNNQPKEKTSTNLTALDPSKKPIPPLTAKTIATPSAPETPGSKDDEDNGAKNWMASYYVGPQFDVWKTSTQDAELTLKPSLRTSLEVSRNLPFNFGISTGVGFNKFEEKYSLNYILSIDTNYVGLDSIPIFDQQNPDSIVGYTYVDVFQMDTVKGNRNNTFNTTAITIPIHLRRTFELTDNWILMTDLGANFNFYKTKKDSSSNPLSPQPVTNSFGLNASMRLHAGYKMDNWVFTVGVNGSIYLKTPVTYDGLTNKRYYFSPQIGIHYIF